MIIAPLTASLNVNMNTLFYAAVAGGTNNTVTWNINGVSSTSQPAGNPNGSLPTIYPPQVTNTGLVTAAEYLAPAGVPGSTVTITAVSTDDTSVTASATVTILAAATVTVSPPNATLAAGATQQYSATVMPAPSQDVTWEVNGLPGGATTLGTISNTGLYTAPASPPPGGSVTITAVSLADTTQEGSAPATLTFGTKSLSGSYAFTLKGENASGAFRRAGSFNADGNGHLSGGLEDVANPSGNGAVSNCGSTASITFIGSFTVGADGRGMLHFVDGLSPSTFRIVMASHNRVEIISSDTTGTAQGEADLQNVAAFNDAGLEGAYIFDFSGLDSGGHPISKIGEFQADGQGGLHNGLVDVNDDGTTTSDVSFTGCYSVTANGRGTAQFLIGAATYSFSFYIVSSGSAKFVALDATPAPEIGGTAAQQSPSAMFSESSLNGNYAFLISGGGALGNIATEGTFAAGGNDVITSGVLDENAAGTATQDATLTGTYSIDATGTGRGEATFTATNRTYTFVFYLDGHGNAVFQETDSDVVSDGTLAQQTPAATLAGTWGLQWGGTATTTTQEFIGAATINGSDVLATPADSPGGLSFDSSTYPGSPGPSQAVTGLLTVTVVSGTRYTLSVTFGATTDHFIVYVVSPTQMFVLEIDSGTLTDGVVLDQY